MIKMNDARTRETFPRLAKHRLAQKLSVVSHVDAAERRCWLALEVVIDENSVAQSDRAAVDLADVALCRPSEVPELVRRALGDREQPMIDLLDSLVVAGQNGRPFPEPAVESDRPSACGVESKGS